MSGSLLSLLQLCDSLFPTGAFSHSDGLEAATTSGRVANAADLAGWMRATRDETLRHLEGPALKRAWRAFEERQTARLGELDAEVHALRSSSTGREASRAMGSRLLKTWMHIRPHSEIGAMLSERASSTLPVAFGVVASAAGVTEREAIEGYAYTRLAAIVSAAMRLMPLGQHDAHRLLADALSRVPQMAAEILGSDEPLGSFAPAIDIAIMSQQYGHSRLFRS